MSTALVRHFARRSEAGTAASSGVGTARRFVKRPWRLAAEVSALVIAVVVAFPLYWMVLSAFKSTGEIESSEPRPWTLSPTLDSFRRVFG